MPVILENPESPNIEQFLIAYGSRLTPQLSLIDPETGFEIYDVLKNMAVIGLTFQPTPSRFPQSLGFIPRPISPTKKKEAGEGAPIFEPEALLILDIDPRSLPSDVKEAWVIQVRNQADEANYVEVAKALSARFGDITIIVTSVYIANPDPTLDPGIHVNPDDSKSPLFCPISIKYTKPT